jgi:hypothetical protein
MLEQGDAASPGETPLRERIRELEGEVARLREALLAMAERLYRAAEVLAVRAERREARNRGLPGSAG